MNILGYARHFLISSIVAALFVGCIASKKVNYPAPDVPAGYVLIDAYSVGHPEDYVKFHNWGDYDSLSAKVMFHNPDSGAWEPYGTVVLKGTGDTDTMKHSTHFGGGLHNLRYFAVKFSDGQAHPFTLGGAHNDLHVYVR